MILVFPLSVVDISLFVSFLFISFCNQDSEEMKSNSSKIPFLLWPLVPLFPVLNIFKL